MNQYITIEKGRNEVIYEGKVKKGHRGKGIIRFKGNVAEEVYVIFPISKRVENGKINIEVDEILDLRIERDEDIYKIDFKREYVGRKCIIVKKDYSINLQFRREEIIFNGQVKKNYGGQGHIRVKDSYLGSRAYVIFPSQHIDDDGNVQIEVDEILNKGIHPDNDHTSRILLTKEYVGRSCVLVLQD